jgi:hypothetical protein
MWIFTWGFVCQYSIIQQKENKCFEHSLNHDDLIIVLVLWNNKIFFLLFTVWFLWTSLTQKNHNVWEDIPRLSAGERGRADGLLQTRFRIRKVRIRNCSMLLSIIQVLWDVIVLIMNSFTIDSLKEIYRLLGSCIVTVSANCSHVATGSVVDRHIQPPDKVTNIQQEGQILFSHRRNRVLNAIGTFISENGGHKRN